MPRTLFSDNYLSTKQITSLGIVIGLIAALFFGGIFSFIQYNKRDSGYNVLAQNMSSYLQTFFSHLQNTTYDLQPLFHANCRNGNWELTSRAAFQINIRTFILVRDSIAFCSSATGNMLMPLKELAPGLNDSKDVDFVIMPETLKMHNNSIIGAWFRSPGAENSGIYATISINLTPYLLFSANQQNISSVALVIGDKALTSNNNHIVNTDQLPDDPVRIAQVPGYPVKLYIFGSLLPAEDLQLSALASVIFGVLVGSFGAYILTVHRRLEHKILVGIKQNQFYLAYQPAMNSTTLNADGFEVLMRWKHPTAGLIPPDVFINAAEAQQLIVPLTRHLFSLVAQDIHKLKTILPVGTKLALNLSPSHLYSSSFKADILTLAAALPQNHFQIVFEITERGMLQEKEATDIFSWLHQQGFFISVDDFGTGNSALIYLERFTIDYLKIDKGFINSICVATATSPVLDAILTIAHRLDIKTVAEGVETTEQARWLIDHGVNYLQGYYFCHPLPLEQFIQWYQAPRHYSDLLNKV
ncbi:cyclic di-GMP phosphodiesterase [uncultured Cedecea sp.]|uniref:cyclic di-GMP phosphodiesterase n=1 Tax=uncultured Cedecea sp. TaxID=988762 RepID=UPI002636AE19|nr:cyclic di-GMP phosphodiesterase [uncultured Cedecea sp.]